MIVGRLFSFRLRRSIRGRRMEIFWAIEAPRPHGREAKAVDTAARRLRAPLNGQVQGRYA